MQSDVRLIDANALLDFIKDEIDVSKEEKNEARARDCESDAAYNSGEIQEARRIKRHILNAPTIDAVPVVHGRWVHDDLGHTYCSKCHERLPYIHCYSEEPCSDYDEEWDEEIPETRYCPRCGAKMDGGAEG